MVQRFEPGGEGGEGEGELDTMGFFIAKFRKTAQYADGFAWGQEAAGRSGVPLMNFVVETLLPVHSFKKSRVGRSVFSTSTQP